MSVRRGGAEGYTCKGIYVLCDLTVSGSYEGSTANPTINTNLASKKMDPFVMRWTVNFSFKITRRSHFVRKTNRDVAIHLKQRCLVHFRKWREAFCVE